MEIIVWGAGQHAKLVIDAIEKSRAHHLTAPVDNEKAGTMWFGYPVWSEQEFARSSIRTGIVARGDSQSRSASVGRILDIAPGFSFVSVVHPAAVVARGVKINEGSFLMAGAIVNADASIGRHCIINTNASVGHDCTIEEFVSISPGATLCGCVSVGHHSFIGAGATIIQGKSIGPNSTIGAGAVVTADIPGNVAAIGIPCKPVTV